MKQLFSICKSPRKVWKDFPDGSHNDSILEPGYFEAVSDFIIDGVVGVAGSHTPLLKADLLPVKMPTSDAEPVHEI